MTETARRYGLGALAHRNFRLFFVGQGISLVGTWMQNVGEGWLILTLTNSPFYVGLTAALSSVGVLLFSLYAGVLADRADKRRVIIFMQIAFMLEAFTVAALVATHVVAVWQVLVLATMLGIASGFDIPMRQSFIVEMVGKDDLMNAIALNSSVFNAARVIGPALAGFLIGAIGIAWCYFLNGLSYIAVIAGLLLMRLPPKPPLQKTASTWTGFREVLTYLRTERRTRVLMILTAILSVFGFPYIAMMPVFARDVLHRGAGGYGALTCGDASWGSTRSSSSAWRRSGRFCSESSRSMWACRRRSPRGARSWPSRSRSPGGRFRPSATPDLGHNHVRRAFESQTLGVQHKIVLREVLPVAAVVRLHVLIALLVGLIEHSVDGCRVHSQPLDRNFLAERL